MKQSDFKSEDDLKKMTIPQIKQHVREFNDHYKISGYSKATKSQLIGQVLTAQDRVRNSGKSAPKPTVSFKSPPKKGEESKPRPAKKAPAKKAPAKKAPAKEIRVYSRSTFDDDAFYVGQDEDAVYTKYKGKVFKIGKPLDYGDVVFDDQATYLPNTVLINERTGKKITKNETDVRESVKDAFKKIKT